MKYLDLNNLETERLILRKANKDDLDAIYNNVWCDKSIADKMLWEVTNSIDEAKDRLDKTIKYQSNHYAYFVCLKDSNEPIGFAGVYEKEENVYEESGICISKKYQGMGYGKEMLKALVNLVFDNLDGKLFIYGCFSDNIISKKLCLSQGFKYLNSEEKVRKHDNYKYISDYYYFDENMYKKIGKTLEKTTQKTTQKNKVIK